MNAPSPEGPPAETPLDVERVEWVPASPETVEVRVVGRWRGGGAPAGSLPQLVVGADRFGAVEHGSAAGGVVWRARFAVPIEVRPRLEGRLALVCGDVEVGLPAASAGPADEGAAPPPAQVVDPTVLAERRARRFEGAEESLVRRAQAAEATAATLRTQLEHLEERLRDAVAERDELARGLRAAEQREEAERRVREELAGERDTARREAEERVAGVRARVRTAEEHAAELAAEMDEVRREGAEAQQEAVAARREAERQLARLSREGGALAAERRAREGLEAELAAERSRAAEAHGAVARLERELARREELQASVRDELRELRGALAEVRERAEAPAGPEVRGALVSLHGTAARLRERVEELERSERAARDEARAAERSLSEARRELTEVRGRVEDERRRRFEAEASLRSELEREREQAAAELAEAEAALRVRVGSQWRAFEEQVETIERLADEVRAELGRRSEELVAERVARSAAEAALGERSAREAELHDLVGEVIGIAGTLRARFDAELQEVAARARSQVEAERDAFRREVEDIQLGLGELREELERERSARRTAERELAAERASLSASEHVEPAVVADRAELEAARAQLAAAQEELAKSRRAQELHEEARSMIANLERAGERLRVERAALERAEAEAVAEETPPPDEPAQPSEPASREPPAPPPRERAPREPAATALPEPAGPAEPEPEPTPRPRRDLTRAAITAGSPTRRAGSHVLRPRIVPLDDRRPTPWLAEAIRRLAADEEEAAAELLVELLALGGAPGGKPLSYRLAIERFGTYRVDLAEGAAAVTRTGLSHPDPVDVSISGPVAALAPLGAGSAGRRLPGAQVEGRRLRLRRLLKAHREPVTLADLVRRGTLLDPGLVLAALARAIEPDWTEGHRFTVAFVVTGRDAGTHWLTVADGAPVTVSQHPPEGETTAIVQVPQQAFLPLLARLSPPSAERLLLLGDRQAWEQLGRWTDRLQGLPEPGA